MFEVVEDNFWKFKVAFFCTILNIVGASSLAAIGIRKLRKQLSFGNTFFQIAKRRCKVFWG